MNIMYVELDTRALTYQLQQRYEMYGTPIPLP